jgi:hypothetical protein
MYYEIALFKTISLTASNLIQLSSTGKLLLENYGLYGVTSQKIAIDTTVRRTCLIYSHHCEKNVSHILTPL